ncbi:MAG: GPR1/FUN34/YaaH family transporter [Syntrophomonadaceae bacterium]|nr:GPR1/FUN34/YaaH family transporter [Syntrophomonadaceae bacterium]MDD3897923.1 GPR1/FUN34/YaaH family transporter [Syntrophomonadaceae bacterium]
MSSNEHNAWASPAPAGLVALAIACFGFYALLTGKVDHSCIPLLGIWLLGGFFVQIIVGIVDLKGGHTTGGNVFLFFSAFFMLVGGMEFIFKYFAAANGWAIDARIDGWAWLVLWIVLVMWTPAYLKQSPLVMSLVVLALDVAVFFVAFMDLELISRSFAPIAGTFLLIGGILGIYVASAIILNTAFSKNVLPMPGPILK